MNWIKMTSNLDTKPEVMMLADLLGIHELHVVGLLWKLWTWLDQNITDCYAVTVTKTLLDRITCAGMCDALQKVGWLKGEDGALIFANFDRHNGKTAKDRACSAKRMKGMRERDAVTPALRSERNNTVTREEKRREEKRRVKSDAAACAFSIPDGIQEPIRTALSDWKRHREEKRKPITPLQWEKLITEATTRADFIDAVQYSIQQGYQGVFSRPVNGNHAKPAQAQSAASELFQVNEFDRNAPKPA